MVTYSSILAWKVPRTEESGRLQSMELAKSWTRMSTHRGVIMAVMSYLKTNNHIHDDAW